MAYSEKPDEEGKLHDTYRIDYLTRHIKQIKIMIDEGLPVFGYCPWSFIDVVSSHQGFAKRYGFVYVDRTDTDPKQCARIKKDRGKTKSATYRQLMGRKMTYQSMISMYEVYGLL